MVINPDWEAAQIQEPNDDEKEEENPNEDADKKSET